MSKRLVMVSSVRFVFCKRRWWLPIVKQCINSLTPIWLREDYFLLTLTLPPIGDKIKFFLERMWPRPPVWITGWKLMLL